MKHLLRIGIKVSSVESSYDQHQGIQTSRFTNTRRLLNLNWLQGGLPVSWNTIVYIKFHSQSVINSTIVVEGSFDKHLHNWT